MTGQSYHKTLLSETNIIKLISIICLLFTAFYLTPLWATTYYISPNGSDRNQGSSLANAWKSLAHASSQKYHPGDRILLEGPHEYTGELSLINMQGTIDRPIIISSSNINKLATINARGYDNGVFLENCSHIKVQNLQITADGGGSAKPAKGKAMRCGVKVVVSNQRNYETIDLKNLNIRNVFYNAPAFKRGKAEVRTANGTQSYGWGIRFINITPKSSMGTLRNIVVKDCSIENVAHTGLKFTSPGGGFTHVNVHGNKVLRTGGPGIQLSGVYDGHFHNNIVDRSGSDDDSRKWGRGSGLWTWNVNRILIERNRFTRANGPGDSAGAHIDFNSNDVIMQYNFSALNAGGFCEILGNNYRCCYRYNISVNDGHRIKGKRGAFQEGKTLWLSGYVGRNAKKHGPYNSYIYNNTIYVNEDVIPSPKVSFFPGAQGVLVANNIFYISSPIGLVEGDQNNLVKKNDFNKETTIQKNQISSNMAPVYFENNLFLKKDIWPSTSILQDHSPLIGDPEFIHTGGLNMRDYMPQAKTLIRNRGLKIKALGGKDTELYLGMNVNTDILGKPIKGLPDLGAIEIP